MVVEREFRTSWVHQGYMEPQSCTAGVDPLGNLTVYASTQGMFFVRDQIARTLGVPQPPASARVSGAPQLEQ